MLDDGINPDGEAIPGTIDPPNRNEEGVASLSPEDDVTLQDGTIDPPNNN